MIRGFLVATVCFLLLFCHHTNEIAASPLQGTVPPATKDRPTRIIKPALIEFKGEIDRKLTIYFKNRFEAARRAGVDLLIIEIDSPGGLKIESLQMARMLRDCDWAYTIAIIRNQAISGGALVSLGVDEILIDPNAMYGDVGEIGFDTEEWAWRLIEPKVESHLSSDARALAESKGRPPDLAEAMVDKDVLVYIRPNPDVENGPPEFKAMRAEAFDQPDPPWELVRETGPERFLTLSGQRTVELGIAQGDETSLEDVADLFGFELENLRVFRPTMNDSIAYFLNNPWVTFLLILIGLIALYFEMSAPGIGIGGLLASLCVVMFFWSRFLGGTSGWLEVILFSAGAMFLVMELFVIPGFGLPGIAGFCLMLSSVVLASQDFVLPHTADQWNQSLTSVIIILASGGGFLVVAVFITKRLGSIPIFNHMILTPRPETDAKVDSPEGKPEPEPHPSISVGDWGVSDSLLRPAGSALFGDRSFDVVSDGAFVDRGTQVRVIRIQGNIITVAVVPSRDE